MGHLDLDHRQYAGFVTEPFLDERLIADGVTAVIVRGDDRAGSPPPLPRPGSLPVVVAWVGDALGGDGPEAADVVVAESDIADLLTAVERAPVAATTLAVLLRSQPQLGTDAGLAAESAAYSTLQAGAEFAAWRASTPSARVDDTTPTVRLDRTDDELTITLDRPHRHNAISTRLRDELASALVLALTDGSIRAVHLRGAGPSFCSGGDLGEFGARPDPALAHRVRLARSPARSIDRLGERCVVHAHGITYGGGAEMAAFAGWVVADPDTRFALPEIGLGLIPGAGGTVSLTRRIGRQRTAALGLTGRVIDASTAFAWGLVDEIADATNGV